MIEMFLHVSSKALDMMYAEAIRCSAPSFCPLCSAVRVEHANRAEFRRVDEVASAVIAG